MYDEKINADFEIFNTIPVIETDGFIVRGLSENLDDEANAYLLHSSARDVKQFLPNAYITSLQEAYEKITGFTRLFLLKKAILFCIADKSTNLTKGYILCNSPLQTFTGSEEAIEEWTINFWISEESKGKGVMTLAIKTVMKYLGSRKAPRVFAFTDPGNTQSIRVLKNANLEFIDDSTILGMFTFAARLQDL